MATDKGYLDYVIDQLSEAGDVSYRPMMGEYVIYFRGKVIGGIYDDRFLVKPTKTALALVKEASMEVPYEGAKEMLLVDDPENRELMAALLEGIYNDLPDLKRKKK